MLTATDVPGCLAAVAAVPAMHSLGCLTAVALPAVLAAAIHLLNCLAAVALPAVLAAAIHLLSCLAAVTLPAAVESDYTLP